MIKALAMMIAIAVALLIIQKIANAQEEAFGKLGGLQPGAYYIPWQDHLPPGSLYFLIKAEEDGTAAIVVPVTGTHTLGVDLLVTPTPGPPPAPTPTITPTPAPTPTRPVLPRPGTWDDFSERIRELWRQQDIWDETWGRGEPFTEPLFRGLQQP